MSMESPILRAMNKDRAHSLQQKFRLLTCIWCVLTSKVDFHRQASCRMPPGLQGLRCKDVQKKKERGSSHSFICKCKSANKMSTLRKAVYAPLWSSYVAHARLSLQNCPGRWHLSLLGYETNERASAKQRLRPL